MSDILLLTETNFVLDLVFEQSQQCERLLSFAQEQSIPIILPEYSMAEAEGNIATTLKKRTAAIDEAISVVKQSARSAYQDVTTLLTLLEKFKIRTEEEERPILHARLAEIESIVSIIPFTSDIAVRSELRGLRQSAPFKPSDQRVYESILQFARENSAPDVTMLLLTRDRNDFDYPTIHQELSAYPVELHFSAGDCIKRLRELVNSEQESVNSGQ